MKVYQIRDIYYGVSDILSVSLALLSKITLDGVQITFFTTIKGTLHSCYRLGAMRGHNKLFMDAQQCMLAVCVPV